LGVAGLAAESNEAPWQRFPEHTEIRRVRYDTIRAPIGELLATRDAAYDQRFAPHDVRVEVRSNEESVYLLFLNESGDDFPVYSQGSYIIKRNRRDGAFVQVKIFLRDDPGFFARIFPTGGRARMNIFLAGRRTYSNVVLPIGFKELLGLPFGDIVRMTDGVVRWDLILRRPNPTRFAAVLDAHEKIMRGREEGTWARYEERTEAPAGSPVGSSLLFAKWVADAMYRERSGELLEVEELAERRPETRGHEFSAPFEEGRDPYLSLDWSRNTAAALHRSVSPTLAGAQGSKPATLEAHDVRSVAFSRYVEDVGFPLGELRRVLFVLAAEDPGHIYLGSVNSERGEDPTLRQHGRLYLFFPRFDQEGHFRAAAVGPEGSRPVSRLEERHNDASIHLVRLPVPRNFSLPSGGASDNGSDNGSD
jgi:hypothetical protein